MHSSWAQLAIPVNAVERLQTKEMVWKRALLCMQAKKPKAAKPAAAEGAAPAAEKPKVIAAHTYPGSCRTLRFCRIQNLQEG